MNDVFVHPTAEVDAGATIGAGTKVWHWSHVMSTARIGTDCTLGQNVFVGEGVVIGDRVKIQNNVSVFSGVTLEDDVFVGPSAVFTNVLRPRSAFPVGGTYETTVVRRGATVGASATIVCGVILGAGCLIGAGAVVTRDVPELALVVGNPAHLAAWVCVCGQALEPSEVEGVSVCSVCARRYRFNDGLPTEVVE